MVKENISQENGNNRSEKTVTVGNLVLVTREDRSWSLFFPNGSLLEGYGNPYTDKAYNAIREDFINVEVAQRTSEWLRKQFEEQYDK